MEGILRWLLRWQGITPAADTELRLELGNFPSGGLGMLVLLGLVAVVLAVATCYRRDGKHLHRWQRIVLASLRAAAVLVVALVLLEPNIVAIEREVRPGHTILLVDTSQSMTAQDAFRKDDVQPLAEAWRALGVADPRAVPRHELAKALLRHGDGELLQKLRAKNELQAYAFHGSLEPLPLTADGRADLDALLFAGAATNFGAALRTALDRSRASEIAAVVVLGDGRRNAGPQAAEAARLLQQRKVDRTFVLGIGDPSATQTVALLRFDAPAKVFQRDPFEVKAVVVAQGYDPTTVDVRLLRRAEAGGEEQEVRRRSVAIGGEVVEAPVVWSDIALEEPGRHLFRIAMAPPDGEPFVAERHERTAPVEALGDRLRVLLVAGGASHEYQILRNLFVRDKTIDVSCWLQSADPKFPQDGDEGVRIERLPATRAELEPYDVVVLIDPDSAKLDRPFCEHVAQHVVEGGAGLWWVAGEKHSLEALRPTASTKPLADLLPVLPDLDVAERQVIGFGKAFPQPFPFALTSEGEAGVGSKIVRLADGRDENKLLWSRLPGFHFWFPVRDLKPAAVALAEHTSPEFRRGGRNMPMLALQNVGAGRVLFAATDESYRWRSLFEHAYDRYWVNGVRHLFEGRLQAGNARTRLFASADQIELGDSVELLVEAKDEAMQPLVAASVPVLVERDGQPVETLALKPTDGAPGAYSVRFRPSQLGDYRVRPAESTGRSVEVAFQVVGALLERPGPVDRQELLAVAAVPGGELLATPQDLLQALDRIEARSATDTFRMPHPVWDGWSTIVLVLVLLSIEWLLRKRFNLL